MYTTPRHIPSAAAIMIDRPPAYESIALSPTPSPPSSSQVLSQSGSGFASDDLPPYSEIDYVSTVASPPVSYANLPHTHTHSQSQPMFDMDIDEDDIEGEAQGDEASPPIPPLHRLPNNDFLLIPPWWNVPDSMVGTPPTHTGAFPPSPSITSSAPDDLHPLPPLPIGPRERELSEAADYPLSNASGSPRYPPSILATRADRDRERQRPVRVRFAHPISSSRTYSPSSEPSAIEPISMGLGLDTGQSIPHYMEQSLALQACSCGDPRCRPPRAQRLCTCGHAECPGAPTQLASTARDAMIAPPRTPEPPPRERERAHPGIGTRHMIVTITAAPWARPPPSAPAARA